MAVKKAAEVAAPVAPKMVQIEVKPPKENVYYRGTVYSAGQIYTATPEQALEFLSFEDEGMQCFRSYQAPKVMMVPVMQQQVSQPGRLPPGKPMPVKTTEPAPASTPSGAEQALAAAAPQRLDLTTPEEDLAAGLPPLESAVEAV